ncbi:MAG: zf-HC2 domain-containing protein [Lachnospiraceae bacterium]|nr:zf-HC2 domain-containing protein [Lachnospiraceae bacterium]
MDCKTAKADIEAYLDKKLTDEEMGEFLAHIRSCPECREELETFFAIRRTLGYLESGIDGSYDIPKLLEEDLASQEARLRRLRRARIRNGLLWALLFVSIAVALWAVIFPETIIPILLRPFEILFPGRELPW